MGGNLRNEGLPLFCWRDIALESHSTASFKPIKIVRKNSTSDFDVAMCLFVRYLINKHNREFKIQLGNSNLILLSSLSAQQSLVFF